METITKSKEFEERIKSLVTEFSESLKSGNLLGYSFFDTDIQKKSNELIMKSQLGLKVMINGEKIMLGADIKFERGGHHSQPSTYAKIYIDYTMSCGRDYSINYHDECSNHTGNTGSINDVEITNRIYDIVYKMMNPIFENSPMPMMS
ncbi:MAG: hypothetical protein AABY15_02095 [Nanoarchaeota archaeon]